MAGRVQIKSLAPGIVQDDLGRAQFAAKVMVYLANTNNLAPVYRDPTGSTQLDQPLKTDRLGETPGYLAPQQVVDISVNGGPVTQTQVPSGALALADLTDGAAWIALIQAANPAAPFGAMSDVAVSTSGTSAADTAEAVNATGGTVTRTLPTGVAFGEVIFVEKTDATANVVNITGTIRGVGATTLTLRLQNESILFVSEGSNSWRPWAGHKTLTSLDARYDARYALGLKRTAVKSAAYTLAAGDLVPVDASGGVLTLTLPSAPADGTRAAMRIVAQAATPNAVTVQTGGTDVFNTTGGPTTRQYAGLGAAATWQYDAATGIWTVVATETPLATASGAAQLGTDNTVGGAGGSSLAAKIVTDAAASPKGIDSTGVADTNVLAYNAASGKYKPAASASVLPAALGDGTDGAITFDGTTNFASFSSRSGTTYTLVRDVNATNVTVNAGVTIIAGSFVLRATGTVTIAATAAFGNPGNAGLAAGGAGGATPSQGSGGLQPGTAGGAGSSTNGTPGAAPLVGGGSGGAGGTAPSGSGGSGVASPSNPGSSRFSDPSLIASGSALSVQSGVVRIGGGGGGGGGAGDTTHSGGGGGGGGGPVAIFALALVNNGTISANGGAGGTPTTGNAGGGGGGGGGLVAIYTRNGVSGTGTITSTGGAAGSGVGTGAAGVGGVNGIVYQRTI